MNVIVYHGNGDSRAILREQEFWHSEPFVSKADAKKLKAAGRVKFHILITTYEVALKVSRYRSSVRICGDCGGTVTIMPPEVTSDCFFRENHWPHRLTLADIDACGAQRCLDGLIVGDPDLQTSGLSCVVSCLEP